jgi:hypothetical protein
MCKESGGVALTLSPHWAERARASGSCCLKGVATWMLAQAMPLRASVLCTKIARVAPSRICRRLVRCSPPLRVSSPSGGDTTCVSEAPHPAELSESAARGRYRGACELELRSEQRDYILGITSLWMLVPAAHAVTSLLSGGLPAELTDPHLLSMAQCVQLRRAVALSTLLPACVISLAAWRWPQNQAYAAIDRGCARTFFAGLVATNLLLQDYELAVACPAGILLLYGASAASEHLGFPRARLWTHASFRCAGFWWAYASCCNGIESIQPWYFALTMAAYWAHIGWCSTGSKGPHYASGCAVVAVMAAAATLMSPALQLQWPAVGT